jgi:hypothetical protein
LEDEESFQVLMVGKTMSGKKWVSWIYHEHQLYFDFFCFCSATLISIKRSSVSFLRIEFVYMLSFILSFLNV